MTNEENKALEIALNTVGERTRNHPSNLPHIIIVRDACIEMASWEKTQMIQKAVEYLYRHNCTIGATIGVEKAKQFVIDIEDFKKAMTEDKIVAVLEPQTELKA